MRNLKAMAAHGWGLLAGPADVSRYARLEPPWRFALDNGAWGCFQRGDQLDERAFLHAVEELHVSADWLVLPDIVTGGMRSLEYSLRWLDELTWVTCPVLIAVQDGMTEADVRPHLSKRVGLFLGGSTEWKLHTMHAWGQLARETGAHYHVGRVNTKRRIRLAISAGAHSCDGTSATVFSVTAGPLAAAAKQQALL